MARTYVKEVTIDGKTMYEANCPHDSTIKPRLPKIILVEGIVPSIPEPEEINETETISELSTSNDENGSTTTSE